MSSVCWRKNKGKEKGKEEDTTWGGLSWRRILFWRRIWFMLVQR